MKLKIYSLVNIIPLHINIIITMQTSNKGYKRERSLSQESVNRILIGVTGGSAAGKTTLCENIQKLMSFDANFNVLLIALDSFYKPLRKGIDKPEDYNFDAPEALDFDMAYDVLKALLKGQKANVPQYCFVTHSRKPDVVSVSPTEVIIFEGILSLYDRRIRDLMKYKIFINCDDDVRLCRRIKRDVEERGRTIEGILLQYHRFVKDAYTNYIAPTMKYADLVIPGFRNNKTSVTFIVQHLKTLTRQMEFFKSALTTRIYFYGQVIDILLQESTEESEVLLDIQNEMQYIFPISEELTKELDLFMNQLINDRFTVTYYKSTFIHQFVRILSNQFQKLLQVKKYNLNNLQLFDVSEFSSFDKLKFEEKKSVFAIFIPMLTKQIFDKLVEFIKLRPKYTNFIILNIWSDHRQIMKLKKQKKCCIINLVCLCDEKKFIEIVSSNVRDQHLSKKQLFESESLIKKSLSLFNEVLSGNGNDY